MQFYNPIEASNIDQKHTVLYTFQYENAFAQVVSEMGGNVSGGNVMDTEFDCGFSVPVRHILTRKHVSFYDEEDKELSYREVGEIIFYYPDGDTFLMDIENCADFLVGIQIIDYMP